MIDNVMKAKSAWVVLSLIATLVAGYLAWISWRAQDGGKWLFMVFTGFLLVLLVAPVLRKSSGKKQDEPVPGTRFAGAWVLPFYLLLFGGLLALAALIGLFHGHGK